MQAPLSWLKEYVKITLSAEKLAEKLLLSGTKVEEIKKLGKETVYDFEITPNRPDTLSVYGIAREIAAITNEELLPLETELLVRVKPTKSAPTIKIIEKKLCPYFTLGLIKDIKIGSSPGWIAERLALSGIRPINNVVDVTNYVMLETGQPMHAFDFDKVEGELVLRAASEGEKVTTLDGVERTLPKGAIIIQDSKKLIDLAGLMGGKNSEIDENTKTILLHVPIYDPVAIRRTSQALGLRTEASNRFEKKLDKNGHLVAFEAAVKLLNEISGAVPASDPRSVSETKARQMSLELSEIKKLLGVEIETKDSMNILSSLGFQVSLDPFGENKLNVVVPSWREDVENPVDLIEEIARIWGYNRFPKTLPAGEIPTHADSFNFDWEAFLSSSFKANGFNQTTTYTFLSKQALEKALYEPTKTIKLSNPMSEEFEYLRPSLLIELLRAVEKNQLYTKELAFFEIGRIFAPSEKELPEQTKVLSFVSSAGFEKVKGLVEEILAKTNFDIEQSVEEESFFQTLVNFRAGKETLGEIGTVKKEILTNFKIESPIYAGTVNLEHLENSNFDFHYKPLPKYPAVIEDLSMFLKEKVDFGKLLSFIEKQALVQKTEVFDIFESEKGRSVAVKIHYLAKDRTLTDSEVAKIRNKIENGLEKNFGAEIRKA